MRRRALVIGSETAGLTGAARDAGRMADALAALGFAVDRVIGALATRDGILDGYRRLVRDSDPDDAAVFYYAGHGCLVRNPAYRAGTLSPPFFQFIVPADMDPSGEGEYRGIASAELSALLSELTARTRNVTVVLDCCHSSRMARSRLRPRALPRPLTVGLDAYFAEIRSLGIDLGRLDVESNPHAVRLVAAGIDECAYEYTNEAGESVGVMTESLLVALREAGGLPVTWEALGRRVRERVMRLVDWQRPEIEGPIGRVLFGLDEPDRSGVLGCRDGPDGPLLLGGALHGVRRGDVYSILPMTATAADPALEIGRATVIEVGTARSRARVDLLPGAVLPEGARAFPARSAARRRRVALDGPAATVRVLGAAIEACPLLSVADEETGLPALATVSIVDDRVHVRDARGDLALVPAPLSSAAVAASVEALRRMAAAEALRELGSSAGSRLRPSAIAVSWGLVEAGEPRPLPRSGAMVSAGEAIHVRIANLGEETIFASVFDVGVDSAIALLSIAEPSGVAIAPGDDHVLGYREGRGLVGLRLHWPRGVPEGAPRGEEFVVVVTERPEDLRALETGYRGPRAHGSPLRRLVEHVQRGGRRDASAEPVDDAAYLIERIPFELHS